MLNWNIDKRFSAEQCLNEPFLSAKIKENTTQTKENENSVQ